MDDKKLIALVAAVETLIDSSKSTLNVSASELQREASRSASARTELATITKDLKSVASSAISSIDKHYEAIKDESKKLFDLKQIIILSTVVVAVTIICAVGLKFYYNSFSGDIEKEKTSISMLLEQKTKLQNEVAELQKAQEKYGEFGAKPTILSDGRTGLAFPQNFNKINLSDGSIFIYKK